MGRFWMKWLSGRSRNALRPVPRTRRRHRQMQMESLEDRRVLTSNLYIDFGDSFPIGGFDLTAQQLRDTFANGGIQGPDIVYAPIQATDNIRLGSLQSTLTAANGAGENVDYNADGTFNSQDYTDLRASILSVVQRIYAPFDINVVAAPALANATSAAYRAAVAATLQLGANQPGERDAWVFMTSAIDTSRANQLVGQLIGASGIAAGADIDLTNATDECAIVFGDYMIGGIFSNSTDVSGPTLDTAFGANVSHEAGHTLGLMHAFSTRFPRANANMVSDSDIMGYSVDWNQYGMFSRYPVLTDDQQTNPGKTEIYYDRFANPLLLGVNATGPAYVTGTGANDTITITRTGTNTALVTVQAFSDAAHTAAIDVPGPDRTFLGKEAVNPTSYTVAGSIFSYTIDTSKGILIDGGELTDWIQIDADLAGTVTVRGGDRIDRLDIVGKGAASAVYTPTAGLPSGLTALNTDKSAVENLGGKLVIGSTTILFQEFEKQGQVLLNNVQQLTFVTPNSADDVTLADGTVAGTAVLTGTSGGIAFMPLVFGGVTTLTIDAATNDAITATDAITIGTLSLAGLTGLVVSGGAGDDTLAADLDGAFFLNKGTLNFQGAAGNNTLKASSNASQIAIAADGTITTSFGSSVHFTAGTGTRSLALQGGISSNNFLVADWGGGTTIDGGAGVDTITLEGSGTKTGTYLPTLGSSSGGRGTFGLTTVDFSGLEPSGQVLFQNMPTLTFITPGAADGVQIAAATVSGTSNGIGFVTLGMSGVKTLTIDAATNDLGSGSDAVTLAAILAGLTKLTINTGAGNDTLQLAAAPTSALALTYLAGPGSDGLNVTADAAQYTLGLTSLTLNTGKVSFSSVENVSISGGATDNLITVTDWIAGGSLQLAGGGGNDRFQFGTGNLNTVRGTINVRGGAGTDRIILNDDSATAAYSYDFNGGKIVSKLNTSSRAFSSFTFDGATEIVTLNASTGANTIRIAPSNTTRFVVNGNSPTTAVADVLIVDVYGTVGRKLVENQTSGSGNWTFKGRLVGGGVPQSIAFTGIETVKNPAAFTAAGTDASSIGLPYVRYVDLSTGESKTFLAYESTYKFGVRAVAADLNGDGVPEVITAPVRARAPEIRVFSALGRELTAFRTLAYAANFLGGVNIAVGDVNGDGRADLITSPGLGPAEIRIYLNQQGTSFAKTPSYRFLGLPTDYVGGATVSSGDFNRDGFSDIVVGSGIGKATTVAVFNAKSVLSGGFLQTPMAKFANFFPSSFLGGAGSVAAADANRDGTLDVVVSQGNGGRGIVTTLDGRSGRRLSTGGYDDTVVRYSFAAYSDTNNFAAVTVVVRDTNDDGLVDTMFTAQASDGKTRGVVRQFRIFSNTPIDTTFFGSVQFAGYSIG
jgi:hypothetical protein